MIPKLKEKGQTSMVEGVIAIVVLGIFILVLITFVFFPIYNLMKDNLSAVDSGFGNIAATILLVGTFVIIPLMYLVAASRATRSDREGL